MTPDELVEHLVDEGGLRTFIEVQQSGIAYEDWDWRALTVFLQGFSRGYLTFSPAYLRDLYEMQRDRQTVCIEAQS
jgi:hypothetical protein